MPLMVEPIAMRLPAGDGGYPNPGAMTRAFMAIVHDGATPEAALAILRGAG